MAPTTARCPCGHARETSGSEGDRPVTSEGEVLIETTDSQSSRAVEADRILEMLEYSKCSLGQAARVSLCGGI